MQGILIEPEEKIIATVQWEQDEKVPMHKILQFLVKAELLTLVYITHDHIVFIDDEGLLKPEPGPFFTIGDYPEPLAGRGILMKVNEEGDTFSPDLTARQVADMVNFPDIKFDGFEEIEPHTKVVEGKEFMVVGTRAHFSPARSGNTSKAKH